jgi:hypothetical protein
MTQTRQPTDEQIIQALKDKKLEYTKQHFSSIEGMWAFNHVHTVLHHAIKIFETPIEQVNKKTFKEKINAR